MDSAPQPHGSPILFERIGGAPALIATVGEFYRRVLADPLLAPLFEGIDVDRQVVKQRAFLALITGGPAEYRGRNLRAAHTPLVHRGLEDTHFDAFVAHLRAALHSVGAIPEDIADIATLADSVRDEVLNR